MQGHGKMPQALSLCHVRQTNLDCGNISLEAYYSVNVVLDLVWWDHGVLLKQSTSVRGQLVCENVMIPWPGYTSCTIRHRAIKHVGHAYCEYQLLQQGLPVGLQEGGWLDVAAQDSVLVICKTRM